ncbi:metal-dependent hydrolase [uncultured Thiothrix sp.]|uniref:metal-dependent hydrolase n=1 Tax=uncultured Thiothrix sp. TaxID=223185 RepID=UPI002620CA70|nr:metal-dependent hydrolase [uncultured Thiothrix sp.]
MANFHTHITWAAAGSGLLSILCLQVGLVGQQDALTLALVGTIGGILPDVDLQHAYPSRIMFSMLGIFVAFLMVFSVKNDMSISELWLVGIGAFLGIRFVFWQIFHKYTTHRGSIHSLIAALFATFSITAMSYHLLGKNDFTSWLIGLFLFIGFILHLVLDEIYSVDFMNYRIKRSFGTALKLFDSSKPAKSMFLLGMTFLVWFATPSEQRFWDTFTSPQTYHIIAGRLLPE